MRLIIDDADLSEIKRLYHLYPIDGVTTNPSILAKAGRGPYEILGEIREFLGPEAELHAQAISRASEDMVSEAKYIVSRLGKLTFIKIPAVPAGIRAIKELSRLGYRTTATAVYTPMQAFMAAKAGASYVAPYVNRIDNLGGNGVEAVKEIQDIFRNNGLDTKILAASFKNSRQVEELCRAGVDAATVSPAVIDSLMKNASVEEAVEKFISDFEGLCGRGSTMLEGQ